MARLKDGFSTIITFQTPQTSIFEKEVTPPSLDGGDAINTTGMRNTAFRTSSPRSLISVGNISGVCAYDTDAYDDLVDCINVNQSIVVTFPDSATLTVYGALKSFTPNSNKEGEEPTANFEISVTNDNNGTETGPVLAAE